MIIFKIFFFYINFLMNIFVLLMMNYYDHQYRYSLFHLLRTYNLKKSCIYVYVCVQCSFKKINVVVVLVNKYRHFFFFVEIELGLVALDFIDFCKSQAGP